MTSFAPTPRSIGAGAPRPYVRVAPPRHPQLRAHAKLDRRRRPARIPQFFAAAGRTLRASRDIMLRNGRAQQIVADDVIVQFGAKAGGNRLGDFEGRKLDSAFSERVADQRRDGYRARLSAVEKSLDLPVPDHPVEQARPAGALAWPEHGSHQG